LSGYETPFMSIPDQDGEVEPASFLRWRQIPSSVWALGLVSLLMDTSSEMVNALLPLYLVTVLGASTFIVGVIEGIAEATASTVKIFSGALSDRLGKRKPIVAAGYGLAAAAKPVFPLAGSVGWIIAARFVDRVGKGIRDAPRDALIADISPAAIRGAAFGLRQSLDTAGAVLGPLFAIVLMMLTASNFTIVFWIAVIPAVLSFAVILFAVDEPGPAPTKAARPPLSRAELARLGSSFWLVVGVATIFTLARFSEAFLLLRAQSVGFPPTLAPVVMLIMNVVYALTAWPAGLLSDKIGRNGLLAGGFSMLVGADLMLAFAPSMTVVAMAAAVWGLHMGLTQGLLASLVADTAPDDLRGTAFGVFNLVTGIGALAASFIAGALWDSFGPTSTFLAGAAFTIFALVVMPFARMASGRA
jgi:MFS family permease